MNGNPFTIAPEFKNWQRLGIRAVRQKHTNLFEITLEQETDFKEFFICSDLHWDNPKCMRMLLRKDLDEAVRRNAGIMIFGDLFCAMQGVGDFRGTKSDVRPEHATVTYLDALVKTALEWFEPYKDHIIFVSPGNHETGVLKRKETDLIERFVTGINHLGGQCLKGDYAGFNVFRLNGPSKFADFKMAYHHGWGGGGPVTRGTIQDVRFQTRTDADCYVFGHVHEKYWHFDPVSRCLEVNAQTIDVVTMRHTIRAATYKEEFNGNGWHIEKGGTPKPHGGWFMKLKLSPSIVLPSVMAIMESTPSAYDYGFELLSDPALYD
jgi:hypothetical protein